MFRLIWHVLILLLLTRLQSLMLFPWQQAPYKDKKFYMLNVAQWKAPEGQNLKIYTEHYFSLCQTNKGSFTQSLESLSCANTLEF